MSKDDEHNQEAHFIELANFLPLEDLARLIEVNRDRIIVFNEGTATIDNLSMENIVCMNGTSIQITVNDSV
tara:strand:- start:156 stop:368 length:213 start_codon:yes stop_codon:yes gene_type:complete